MKTTGFGKEQSGNGHKVYWGKGGMQKGGNVKLGCKGGGGLISLSLTKFLTDQSQSAFHDKLQN